MYLLRVCAHIQASTHITRRSGNITYMCAQQQLLCPIPPLHIHLLAPFLPPNEFFSSSLKYLSSLSLGSRHVRRLKNSRDLQRAWRSNTHHIGTHEQTHTHTRLYGQRRHWNTLRKSPILRCTVQYIGTLSTQCRSSRVHRQREKCLVDNLNEYSETPLAFFFIFLLKKVFYIINEKHTTTYKIFVILFYFFNFLQDNIEKLIANFYIPSFRVARVSPLECTITHFIVELLARRYFSYVSYVHILLRLPISRGHRYIIHQSCIMIYTNTFRRCLYTINVLLFRLLIIDCFSLLISRICIIDSCNTISIFVFSQRFLYDEYCRWKIFNR